MSAALDLTFLQGLDHGYQPGRAARPYQHRLCELIQKFGQEFGNAASLFVRLGQVNFFTVNSRISDFSQRISHWPEGRRNGERIDAFVERSFCRCIGQLFEQALKADPEKRAARAGRRAHDFLRFPEHLFDVFGHLLYRSNAGTDRPNHFFGNPEVQTVAVRAAADRNFVFRIPPHHLSYEPPHLLSRTKDCVIDEFEVLCDIRELHSGHFSILRTLYPELIPIIIDQTTRLVKANGGFNKPSHTPPQMLISRQGKRKPKSIVEEREAA